LSETLTGILYIAISTNIRYTELTDKFIFIQLDFGGNINEISAS